MNNMGAHNLAIVIVAYNRHHALSNLLHSVAALNVGKDRAVDLIISIDNKGTAPVIKISEEFVWDYGSKRVIVHEEKLGLKKHFFWAGDLTQEYDNVLFLEDDLYLSPFALDFVDEYVKTFSQDDRIAGASLYNPILCEFIKCKFYQVQDGYDNFFFQHPYWGNIWSKRKWMLFKQWFEEYQYKPEILPYNVRLWGEKSFKKIYIQYLIETKRYIVYPRNSYITNMGVKGTHNDYDAIQFQVVLENGHRDLKFSTLEQSDAIYDAFYEISADVLKRYYPTLKDYDFSVDLLGVKDRVSEQYILTSRSVSSAIISFDNAMRPLEQNIILGILGQGISLSRTDDVIMEIHGIRKKFYLEKLCASDIMRNYPVRFKHLAFATVASLIKNNKD